MKIRMILLGLLALCALPSWAQPICQNQPAESHIDATDPGLIPPGADAWLLTHTNTWFRGRANHLLAYVQTGPNEQRVWFYVNSVPHYPYIYYNRRFRTDATAPWKWAYRYSPRVMDLGRGSISANTVLYSATPKYGTGNGVLYKYAMFLVNQPRDCDGIGAGYGMVSLSNDGFCWTAPVTLQIPGGPTPLCAGYGSNLFEIEALDAIDAGSQVYFIGIKGDGAGLLNYQNMDQTYSIWASSTPASLRNLTAGTTPAVSTSGIVSPEGIEGIYAIPDRFKTYSYLINLAMAWDAARGDLYLTRAYPYPYDRYSSPSNPQPLTVPARGLMEGMSLFNTYLATIYPDELQNPPDEDSDDEFQHVQGCVGDLFTYPNRIQIYKMNLGSLSNFAAISTGTWTLVADYGNQTGYNYGATNSPGTPLISPQQNVGRDYGAASFLKDGTGNIQFAGGAAYVFGGTQYLSPLSGNVPCRVTGTERTHTIAIPGLTP